MARSAESPRRIGRPRKREVASGLDPRSQILDVAAGLFAERGVADVSMLEIAERSGLGQSSLYYWFRKKELVVAEILGRANRLPLDYAAKLRAEGESADAAYYRFVRFDVRLVCEFPLELTEIHRFAAREPSAFASYWEDRRALTRAVADIVSDGIASGVFRDVDPYLVALTTLANDESVQNWFARRDGRSAPRIDGSDEAAERYDVDTIATHAADASTSAWLVDPARLGAIRDRARSLDRE